MKPFHIKTISLVLLSASPQAIRAGDASPPSEQIEITADLIDRLVAEARGKSPALQSAAARTKAANASVDAIRTWDDPTASFGLWAPTSRGFASSQEGNLIYGLEQKLPLYGRPDLARKVAAADASREMLTADFEERRLRRDVALALNSLALAGREAEIAREDLTWLDSTLDAVDHRYRVGRASQVDWLKIQTSRALADNDAKSKEQERDHGVFALNRLLNRDPHVPWPGLAVPPLQPPVYYTEALVSAALAAEPRLRVMRKESASAQAAADLTRSQRLPDVSVGLEARQYSGDGGFREGTATVSFSVPWLNRTKYGDDWQRAQQLKRAVDLAAEDYALSIREDLHHHVVELDAARRKALLYRNQLIPLAQQTLRSAETAWEHNLGPFQDVLDAHRLELADDLALGQALTEQNSLLAELSYLTGRNEISALMPLAGDPPADRARTAPDRSP